MSLTELTSSTN
uniref:Uncharacterized protein n=1 Tax=Arundo donax TaxID=35708 RepID=A0A0A8Y690_ARUDO